MCTTVVPVAGSIGTFCLELQVHKDVATLVRCLGVDIGYASAQSMSSVVTGDGCPPVGRSVDFGDNGSIFSL